VSEHVTAAMLSMQPSVQSGCTQVFSGARGLGNAALLAVLHGLACSAHPLMRPAQDRPAGAGETRGVGWALLSALGTLLLNHLQLRLCRVHLRFHVRRLQQLLLPSQVLSQHSQSACWFCSYHVWAAASAAARPTVLRASRLDALHAPVNA